MVGSLDFFPQKQQIFHRTHKKSELYAQGSAVTRLGVAKFPLIGSNGLRKAIGLALAARPPGLDQGRDSLADLAFNLLGLSPSDSKGGCCKSQRAQPWKNASIPEAVVVLLHLHHLLAVADVQAPWPLRRQGLDRNACGIGISPVLHELTQRSTFFQESKDPSGSFPLKFYESRLGSGVCFSLGYAERGKVEGDVRPGAAGIPWSEEEPFNKLSQASL